MRKYRTQIKKTITTTIFSTPLGEMFTATSKKCCKEFLLKLEKNDK